MQSNICSSLPHRIHIWLNNKSEILNTTLSFNKKPVKKIDVKKMAPALKDTHFLLSDYVHVSNDLNNKT